MLCSNWQLHTCRPVLGSCSVPTSQGKGGFLMRLLALLVCLMMTLTTNTRAEIRIGRGPISCLVPVDSLDLYTCERSVVMNGRYASCKTSAMKDGIEYTVTIHGQGQSIPGFRLPPIAAVPAIRMKGPVAGRCSVTGEVTTATCTSWGTELRGGGSCTFCTEKGCYRGSVQISMRTKQPIRRSER